MENLNIKRFGSYFKADLNSTYSKFGISFLTLASMPIFSYLFYALFQVLQGNHWAGMSYKARLVLFVINLICICVTLPAKAYGHVTEKRAGSSFILLPVSTLEKFLSMFLVCFIVVPVCFIAGYALADLLVCLIDPSCGTPLADFSEFAMSVQRKFAFVWIGDSSYKNSTVTTPVYYFYNIIQLVLYFLLGAICFKKSKVTKTILALILLSFAGSIIFSVILFGGTSFSSNEFIHLMEKFPWALKHLYVVDAIKDTILSMAVCAAIYFRLKTIKY